MKKFTTRIIWYFSNRQKRNHKSNRKKKKIKTTFETIKKSSPRKGKRKGNSSRRRVSNDSARAVEAEVISFIYSRLHRERRRISETRREVGKWDNAPTKSKKSCKSARTRCKSGQSEVLALTRESFDRGCETPDQRNTK